MFKVGDVVRVREYDDIPEHPAYRQRDDAYNARCYFGMPEDLLRTLRAKGEMIVASVLNEADKYWYGATFESEEELTKTREPVYTLQEDPYDSGSGVGLIEIEFHYRFLGNMLEPVEEPALVEPDADALFASLF